MNIKIRTETAADIPAIEAVTIAAFLNAPHTRHTDADTAGSVIGPAAVSPVSIADATCGWFGLGPLLVADAYHEGFEQ